MRINIIYEINNREYYNCLLLERELRKRGHKAYIYNKTEDCLLTDNSRSVTLIPNSYRSSDVDHYRYCFNTGDGPIIVYPCEQVTNHVLPTFFDYTENNSVKKLPHLCWGNDYYQFIKNLGFDMSYSKIVGAVQLDYCRNEFKDFYMTRKEISERYHINNDKKWILFISDFVLQNDEKYNRLLEAGDVSEDVLVARKRLELDSSKEILRWFDRFLKDHNDYILIYRKHPVEILSNEIIKFQQAHPKQVYTISELSIKEWIMSVDRLTTWNSTSVVECYAAGKNVQLLRPIRFSEETKMAEYPFFRDYPSAKNYDELNKKVTTDAYSYNEDVIKEIQQLYSIESKPAYERVADAIEFIAENWEHLGPVDKSYNKKRLQYIMKNMVLPKIMVKKTYEVLYRFTGLNLGKQEGTGASINEWTATAINKMNRKRLISRIDSIIGSDERSATNGKTSD